MVAFLLSGTLTREAIQAQGREIMIVAVTVVVVSIAIVAGGLPLTGLPFGFAILLGTMATSTAPAATQDVVRQSGVCSRFATRHRHGRGGRRRGAAAGPVGGRRRLALGLVVGVPAAVLTGRIKPGEPTLIETLLVFLMAGLAMVLEVSYLLDGIVAGVTIATHARHHERPFYKTERIEWPFLLLFFVVAGASFEVNALEQAGLVCVAYILLRAVSRVIGGWAQRAGGGLAETRLAPSGLRADAAGRRGDRHGAGRGGAVSDLADQVVSIILASTILFEIVGPLLTQAAITRSERTEPPPGRRRRRRSAK